MFYNKKANILFQDNNTSLRQRSRIRQANHRWTSPPSEWYKWNTEASTGGHEINHY